MTLARGHSGSLAVSLLFDRDNRPHFSDLQRLSQNAGGFAVTERAENAGGEVSYSSAHEWPTSESAELLMNGLTFDIIGIAPGESDKAPEYQYRFGFDEAFRDKGRFAGFMKNFSVSVIEDDYAALTGCASHMHHIYP